jgi:hypothetical protein
MLGWRDELGQEIPLKRDRAIRFRLADAPRFRYYHLVAVPRMISSHTSQQRDLVPLANGFGPPQQPLAANHHMADMEPFNIEAEMASLLHDMSNEDLLAFAESQDDPAADEQIELYIYACFLIFNKSYSTEHLERAVQQAEGWVAVTPTDHPHRARRFHILDTMSAWMHQHRSTLEDIVPTHLQVK